MWSPRLGSKIEADKTHGDGGHAFKVSGLPCVLIVDDAATVRIDLQDVFEGAGFDVTLCETKQEALAWIGKQAFDLIVLDVLLPDGNGLDVLRALRTMPRARTTPVIVLSSEARATHYLSGLGAGADEYVGKPYDRAYLLRRAIELGVSGAAETRPALPAAARASVPCAKKILVADADVESRARFCEMLVGDGYEARTASSGDDVLSVLAVERVDAVVLSDDLSGQGGVEICRRIRNESGQRFVPVIIVAAKGAEPLLHEQAKAVQADDLVMKIKEPLLLKVRLRTILNRELREREGRHLMSRSEERGDSWRNKPE